MRCFKKLKFCKRAGNCRTGLIRSVVKCLCPCIARRSRSPSPEYSRNTKENKTLENCTETPPNGRTGAQYEALIQAERQPELIDIQRMTGQEKSPNTPQFDGISLQENKQEQIGLCLEDFKIIQFLGEGAYGQVLLAKKKYKCGHCSSEDVFAIKCVRNYFVINDVEKEVLLRAVGHPFLVQLFSYFQDKDYFCYVMEYCEGGTLLSMISSLQRFHEDLARFYAAEIILAVNFLHKCGIVHRDIKPDNILLDRDGHCRLADFGFAAVGMFKGKRTQDEMILGSLYEPVDDWWSVGSVMWRMMVGDCPRECLLHPEQPPLCLTEDAICIINMFHEKDPSLRLGANGDTRSIFMHPFFKAVNWEAVLEKRVKPPVKLVNSKFVIVDLEVHGDTDESGSELSFKTASEGPSDNTQTAKCATADTGACGKMKKLATAVAVVVVSLVLIGNILYKY